MAPKLRYPRIAMLQASLMAAGLLTLPLGVFASSDAMQNAPAGVAVQTVPLAGGSSAEQRLTVGLFVQLIAKSDELVRAQAMEQLIASEGLRGAKALYEPFLFASLERDRKFLPTTAEEFLRRSSSFDPYESYVNQLRTGVAMKAPTGAEVDVFYDIDNMKNSLQSKAGITGPEYRGSLGFSISQPLLRGAGPEFTESGVRVADREQAIAQETVRQVLAQRITEGLQSYLFVQRAQGRVYWRQRALDAASQLESEISRQFQVGLKSQNELTESRASLALRQAQFAQAQQDLEEQVNVMQVFLAAGPETGAVPKASRWVPGEPLRMPASEFADSLRMTDAETAFLQRPETRINQLRIQREDIKRAAALNQALPELKLRLRHSKDSLRLNSPLDFPDYYSGTSRTPFETWTVGLQFRMGLGGDVKKDSEYQAAMLRKTQSELALRAAQQRITNELLGVKAVLDRALSQVDRQAEIVRAQQSLLAAERNMMKEGQRSLLDILRREIEVALAQEAYSDVLAQVNRSSFLASQVNGTLLARFGLE